MSFGVGIGDIFVVLRVASEVYNSFREAPYDYRVLLGDLQRLYSALKGVSEVQEVIRSDKQREKEFIPIIQGCYDVLQEFKAITAQFYSLGTSNSGFRDRLKWSPEDSRDLRLRLISNLSSLSEFYARLNM